MITTGNDEELPDEEELPYAGDLDLGELWAEFLRGDAGWVSRHDRFRQFLRERVCDPHVIKDVSFCDDCGIPGWNDELTATGNQSLICESCLETWSTCNSCEEYYQDGDLNSTLDDEVICDSCRDNYYTYCESCEGYYHDDDSGRHTHGDGCCESPQPAFTIRNDGCEPLANDTRVTVTLPAGIISDEGMKAIYRYLRGKGLYEVSGELEGIGSEWQAKTGNFAKRLSRQAYSAHGVKLSPEVLSAVGCIAREHSTPVSMQIEVTRDLNQDADYFYHEDSCWWGSYSKSRCALKTSGGFGLRSFDDSGVSGRAWVLPLKQDASGRLTPTFETMTPAAFAVFNGYGELSGYAAARIMAHLSGWTYRKIGFSCSPMYVNAGGYLVAPEVIAGKNADVRLSVSQHSDLHGKEHANAA